MKRRTFLQVSAAGTLLPTLFQRVTFAAGGGDARFILIILRGAMDGLAAVPAYGDPNYEDVRGSLALPGPGQNNGVLPLDDLFGLHPAFRNLYALYQDHELLVCHAMATPYRERSHFDGQKVLENGTADPLNVNDGWLNRALQVLPNRVSGGNLAIALSQTVPLVLYGGRPVSAWAPSSFPDLDALTLDRISQLYRNDAFFNEQFQSALQTRGIANAMEAAGERSKGNPGRIGQLPALTNAAAEFLRAPDGPRIAVLQTSGWDTHANQGATEGYLAVQFKALDNGIQELKEGLGAAWSQTVIIAASEFGRTAAVNGSRGTDHGTAGAVFVAGGAVRGGRVLSDWPGLSRTQLYQGRDLRPVMDTRSIFKSVLSGHLRLSARVIESKVFPDSANARLTDDLVNTGVAA